MLVRFGSAPVISNCPLRMGMDGSHLRELPFLLALAILARCPKYGPSHTPFGEVEEFTRAAAAEWALDRFKNPN
jgi:hypothetical protein